MEVKFLTHLQVEKMAGNFWRTLTEFVVRAGDQVLAVPRNYVTDFASVPRLPLAYLLTANTAHEAATLHDWLYSTGQFPRAWCDEVFLAAMKCEGLPWWRRQMMYLAVRVAGGSRYGAAAS
jgi:hypothetical protein